MNASGAATPTLRATEIVFHLESRCGIPTASQASRKICWMSADVFVRRYLGYLDLPRQADVITREPSEWTSPRWSCRGYRSTTSRCQPVNVIGRSCFMPAPCSGNSHGQWFQYDEIATQPTARTSATRSIAPPLTRAIVDRAREMKPFPRYEPRR